MKPNTKRTSKRESKSVGASVPPQPQRATPPAPKEPPKEPESLTSASADFRPQRETTAFPRETPKPPDPVSHARPEPTPQRQTMAQPAPAPRPPVPEPAHRPPATQPAPAPAKPRAVEVRFSLFQPNATRVSLCSEANRWSPGATPMQRSADGWWRTTVSLQPGRYQYKFFVDGEWLADPKAPETVPNQFGTVNSVVVVGG